MQAVWYAEELAERDCEVQELMECFWAQADGIYE
jgi:hypothetical protein